jgi:hypothetical protein
MSRLRRRRIRLRSEPAKGKATYEDIYTIPDNMMGESIDGELMVTPGPAWKQALATTGLGSELGHSSQPGKSGGADGGIIRNPPQEYEIHVLFYSYLYHLPRGYSKNLNIA